MNTSNVQQVKQFSHRFSRGDGSLEPFGTVDIVTDGGRAIVFYDNLSQVLDHISALTKLAREMDEHQKTEGVE